MEDSEEDLKWDAGKLLKPVIDDQALAKIGKKSVGFLQPLWYVSPIFNFQTFYFSFQRAPTHRQLVVHSVKYGVSLIVQLIPKNRNHHLPSIKIDANLLNRKYFLCTKPSFNRFSNPRLLSCLFFMQTRLLFQTRLSDFQTRLSDFQTRLIDFQTRLVFSQSS
jgi:hypothetical protein